MKKLKIHLLALKKLPLLLLSLFLFLISINCSYFGNSQNSLYEVKHRDKLISFNPERTQFAYISKDSQSIVLEAISPNQANSKTSLALNQAKCFQGYAKSIVLLGNRQQAIIYGSASNMPLSIFGHAGKHITADCWVDFKKKNIQELSKISNTIAGNSQYIQIGKLSGNLYSTLKYHPLYTTYLVEVMNPSLTQHQRITWKKLRNGCRVSEYNQELYIICMQRNYSDKLEEKGQIALLIDSYSLKSFPLKFNQSLEFELNAKFPSSIDDMIISHDGSKVIIWDSQVNLEKIIPNNSQNNIDKYQNQITIFDLQKKREVWSKKWSGTASIHHIDAYHENKFLMSLNIESKNFDNLLVQEIDYKHNQLKNCYFDKNNPFSKAFNHNQSRQFWVVHHNVSQLKTCQESN